MLVLSLKNSSTRHLLVTFCANNGLLFTYSMISIKSNAVRSSVFSKLIFDYELSDNF